MENKSNPTQQNTQAVFRQRHARLAVELQSRNLDGLILNPGPSLRYFTGLEFHLSERPAVAIFQPHNPTVLILPEFESIKLKQLDLPIQAFLYEENPAGWQQVFNQAASSIQLDYRKMGVEPNHLRFLELSYLEKALPDVVFVSGEELIAGLRMVKHEHELSAMRKAVEIAQEALLATIPMIKPGKSEREISAELVIQLLQHGSSPMMPFQPIVASGPNSANPHAHPTKRQLQEGDLLIIDWGAKFEHYVSDLTRTFAIGKVEPEFEEIALIVKEANAAAQQAVRSGVSAGEVDKAARQVIEEAGYGAYFTHRTGHGLGLEGHEPPYLFTENDFRIAPNMTFTIEPGIYLPTRGGVRIEDDFVAGEEAGFSLSNLPRKLIKLG